MAPRSFQFNASLPADARYAEPVRDLAAHAARYAGCEGADAETYGRAVEAAMRACLAATGLGRIAVMVRRADGPVECLIACERRVEGVFAADPHITVDWVDEAGRQVCRVARTMPLET